MFSFQKRDHFWPFKAGMVLEQILLDVRPHLSEADQQRAGGYFCVMDRSQGDGAPAIPMLLTAVGHIPIDKAQKYHDLAIEKAQRLIARPDTMSSYQTRLPGYGKWGGAIASRGGIVLSFSGLPEHADEALMLALGHDLKLVTLIEGSVISQLSNNQIYPHLIHR